MLGLFTREKVLTVTAYLYGLADRACDGYEGVVICLINTQRIYMVKWGVKIINAQLKY